MATKANTGPAAVKKLRKYAATANTLGRTDLTTTLGEFSNFDNKNRFRKYQQLTIACSFVNTGLLKFALSLVKNPHFDGDQSKLAEFKRIARKTNLIGQLQTQARLVPRDGIYAAKVIGKSPETARLQPFLMPYTTVLPDGYDPKAEAEILEPEAVKIVTNEGLGSREKSYPLEEVVYTVLNEFDAPQLDIRGRETFGLYGSSLLDPLESPIKYWTRVCKGYVSHVDKYGISRYVVNFRLLEELVLRGEMTYQEAAGHIDEFNETYKDLKQGEDITGIGLDILTPDLQGNLDVNVFRQDLETEISVGLFQNPVTTGKNTYSYASAYAAEEDRFEVLNNFQLCLQESSQNCLDLLLPKYGMQAGNITVEFEKINRIKITASEMQEMYNTGVISKEFFIRWAGFPPEEAGQAGQQPESPATNPGP